MVRVRKSDERGRAYHGWLRSRHTFSFANYYDPEHMGYRALRVINEDRIDGGSGFGGHPHRDMEIISYVVSGGLKHEDSTGNSTVIRPGEIQRMYAGSGVVHSEFNEFPDQETHFFQIWILPDTRGGRPEYGQKSFEEPLKEPKLVLVASPDGREGSLHIHQDVDLYLARLERGDEVTLPLRPGRGAWVQVVHGRLTVNGTEIETGDGLTAADEPALTLHAEDPSEFMLFDLG